MSVFESIYTILKKLNYMINDYIYNKTELHFQKTYTVNTKVLDK